MPLAVALGACLLGAPASAAEPPASTLDLVWVDLTDLSAWGPAPIERVSADVRELLAPLGVRVAWRVEAPGRVFPGGQVTVVLARSNLNPSHAGRPVAGAVTVDPGEAGSLSVFPAVVAGGIGLTLERLPLWTFRQRREFTRALAMVVAHELAHRVAGAGHSPGGLMSETLCSRQLRDRGLGAEPRLAAGFRAALARPPGPGP